METIAIMWEPYSIWKLSQYWDVVFGGNVVFQNVLDFDKHTCLDNYKKCSKSKWISKLSSVTYILCLSIQNESSTCELNSTVVSDVEKNTFYQPFFYSAKKYRLINEIL